MSCHSEGNFPKATKSALDYDLSRFESISGVGAPRLCIPALYLSLTHHYALMCGHETAPESLPFGKQRTSTPASAFETKATRRQLTALNVDLAVEVNYIPCKPNQVSSVVTLCRYDVPELHIKFCIHSKIPPVHSSAV